MFTRIHIAGTEFQYTCDCGVDEYLAEDCSCDLCQRIMRPVPDKCWRCGAPFVSDPDNEPVCGPPQRPPIDRKVKLEDLTIGNNWPNIRSEGYDLSVEAMKQQIIEAGKKLKPITVDEARKYRAAFKRRRR